MTISLFYSGTNLQYINNNPLKPEREQSIIKLTVYGRDKQLFKLRGVFKTFFAAGSNRTHKLSRVYDTAFSIYSNGKYLVPPANIQPTVRSIPSFPRRQVKPGAVWHKPASFNYHDIKPAYFFAIPVEYKYLSNQNDTAVILVNYSFDKKKKLRETEGLKEPVIRIYGKYFSLLYWDKKKNLPVKAVEKFNEFFIRKGGNSINISKEFNVKYKITFPVSRKELEDSKEDVNKIKGLSSYVDHKGLHIMLEDILFAFDSYKLDQRAAATLDKLKPVLQKYKDYEFSVEGHTDNTGSKKYNQQLSEQRAATVADFLKKMLPSLKGQIYYKGYGPDKPRFDNSTAAGRKKNRRVEIHIKDRGK